MGQSLADAAVGGTSSDITLSHEKRNLLAAGDIGGLIALNRTEFGSFEMMAKDNGKDDEEDGDDEDDPRDVKIQQLSAEAKKKRLRIREQTRRIAELEAENTRLKGAKGKDSKDEDEDDDESSEALKAEQEKSKALEERLTKQAIQTEFTSILANPKTKIKFADPKIAFRLLDLDDVEVDEDYTVDGLEDAIKDLAKTAPYLLAKSKDEDDEDDEDERPRRTGQRSGTTRKKGKPNRDALMKKYSINR